GVPDGAAAERLFRDRGFADEAPILSKHLQSIVGAIADIHQTVVGQAHRVDDPELRRRWTVGIVLARPALVLHGAAKRSREFLAGPGEPRIVRRLAVRAPMALVRAGGSV